MPHSFEVYDDEKVQLETRRQVGHLIGYALGGVLLTILLVALVLQYQLSLLVAAGLLVFSWGGILWGISRRLRILRRIVWCVKISDARILGYDYARRPNALRWNEVEYVNFVKQGAYISGSEHGIIHITNLFPDFSDLSHRIFTEAEKHGIPILVDGRSLDNIDIHELYPFLMDTTQSAY